jgi:hypothetical protein
MLLQYDHNPRESNNKWRCCVDGRNCHDLCHEHHGFDCQDSCDRHLVDETEGYTVVGDRAVADMPVADKAVAGLEIEGGSLPVASVLSVLSIAVVFRWIAQQHWPFVA